ncbi:MAG: SusC/RagA family TonB-linked outer membrane protein, partial [Chitinophagaceae bacterium]
MLCLLLSVTLFSQSKTVTGKVTDGAGVPLPDVSVQVRNSNVGAKTNEAGLFTIQLPANRSILIFSSVGFENREVDVTNQSTIDITLNTSGRNLQEVVVTALGITRDKRSLGYATQNIKGEEIVDRGEINVVSALQGKVAGVDITGA